MRRLLLVSAALAAGALVYVAAIVLGAFGALDEAGVPAPDRRPAAEVAAGAAVQAAARERLAPEAGDRQILFGDLHVHTTFSLDAFVHSLPLMQGEGAHPPADACDYARFCSALDFFSLNDHAEGLVPKLWADTKRSVRACNEVAGDPADPDLVAFVGWEWTQMGATPEAHYGHKNVLFRETAEDAVPTRPIAAAGVGFDTMRARGGQMATLALSLADFGNRERYFGLGAVRRAIQATPLCPAGVPVRELPLDCAEAVATPRELFAKLDEWGFESLVIPHGNAWGHTTPAGVTWDKQLANGHHDPDRQTLIEVYSGHGSSEHYRSWRQVVPDGAGGWRCPEPSPDFTPSCWRAGEIIRERCLAAGEAEAECERRAARTRERTLAAGWAGHFVVPGVRAEDWLDAGQCRDCFQPAFEPRPGGSVQYALAAARAGPGPGPDRFRFGLIASSDTHFARPASGYKEFRALGATDLWGREAQRNRALFEPGGGEPLAESRAVDPASLLRLPGGDAERSASFYYTGGLVAVHAAGRDRGAVWDALRRREVYGTSGPRILLWFDLLNPETPGPVDGAVPMGGEATLAEAPRFRARALGARVQRPGCPESARRALGEARVERLCGGECHHPGDRRHAITRIEVVRIRPRISAEEDVAVLIEDPWRVLGCPADGEGCEVVFDDPEFPAAGRDHLYYVRAIQEPTPQVNGDGLRCETDEEGRCLRPRPCAAGDGKDECLGLDEARAWSSPLFVDYRRARRAALSPQAAGGRTSVASAARSPGATGSPRAPSP